MLTVAFPRNRPVMPPLMKNSKKAIENSIGTVRWMFPCQSVSTQLYTFNAVGTAMMSVVVAKKKPK